MMEGRISPAPTQAVGSPFQIWNGQRLQSDRNHPLALHPLTEPIGDPRVLPRLTLVAASDGTSQVILQPEYLAAFLLLHKDAYFVGHDAAFAFWVIDAHLKEHRQEEARRVLWEACDEGRLLDTQILDMLLQLATGQFRHAATAQEREGPIRSDPLAIVAAAYLSLRLPDLNPHERAPSACVGGTLSTDSPVQQTFFTRAALEAYTIAELYPALASLAYQTMLAGGFDPQASHYDIRPDALERFGYLSEIIQVKASVVLNYLFRRGVRVNMANAKALEARYRAEVADITLELARSYPDVLTCGADGFVKLAPQSRTPLLEPAKLSERLIRVIQEITHRNPALRLPVAADERSPSLSTEAWAPYLSLHPFLGLWRRLTELKPLLECLTNFTAPVLHSEYHLLARTGRTSCSKPREAGIPGLSLQQVPHVAELRALFESEPGCKFFTGDYVAAEARTLAAVCKAKFGSSVLADIQTQGIDTHAYTAAALLGMSLEAFLPLKDSDPPRYQHARQIAKALLFGIAGGMGAASLQEYVRKHTGFILSWEDAQRVRTLLVTEVYPELNDRNGYLADPATLGMKEITPVQGGSDLSDRPTSRTAATLTGRLRAGLPYTASKNTPFQSLAADGAKLALWNLLYAGFDVCGFIHDEILVQLPVGTAEEAARQVQALLVRSMETVMGQGIPAACARVVADCWRKP
jgi:hypothetical protein